MTTHPLLHDARFDLADFLRRWARARKSALASVAEDAPDADVSEEELVRRVKPEREDALLRAVFERSRMLGLGLSRLLGLSLERDDFEDLLTASGIRCFAGSWERRTGASVLRRRGCGLAAGDSIVCGYWREAVDGLVMGAGASERFARHGNVLFGDSDCEDVLFLEEKALRPGGGFGPIPPRLAPDLPKIQTLFRSIYRMELRFPGYADGVLYYTLQGESGTACGPGARLLERTLTKKLEALQPGLRVKDASPTTIIGGLE